MKPIICSCGTEKRIVAGYIASCPHCDMGACPDRGGCILCGTYSVATNQRVTTEHARERLGHG